nr:hypothetical protein [Tanacetum cinerariifolium]
QPRGGIEQEQLMDLLALTNDIRMGAVDSRSSHASQEQKDAGGRVLFNVVACVDFSQQDDF